MAKTVEELLEENNELLRGVVPRITGSRGPITSAPSIPMTSFELARDRLTGAANTMVDVFAKISSGHASAEDALKAASFVTEKFGGSLGSIASNALTKFGGMVMEVNNTMKITGEYGVTIGNNLGEFNKSVLQSHQTMQEFAELVARNSTQIAGIGGTMDDSALALNSVVKTFVESEIGKSFVEAGMSAEQFATIAQISLMNRRGIDIKDEKSRAQLADSVAYLATEIDLSAQIAGKSRAQEEAELRQQQERADVMAMIQIKGPKFAESLEQATVGLTAQQKRVVEILATGGPKSVESTQLIAAYAQSMPQLARLAQSIETHDRTRIAAAKEEAQIATTAQMRNVDTLTRVIASEGKGIISEGYKEFASRERAIAAMQKELMAAGKPATIADAEKEMRIRQEMKLRGVDREGEIDAAQVATRSINELGYIGKVAASGLSEGFKKLNDELGTSTKNTLPQFNDFLKRISSPEGIVKEFNDAKEKLRETGQNLQVPVLPKEEATPKVGREFGSFGSVGKWIEDWGSGTPVMLHGKEGVFTEDQLKSLGFDFNSTFKNLGMTPFSQQSIEKPVATPKKEESSFLDMFYDIGNMAGKMFNTTKEKPKVEKEFDPNSIIKDNYKKVDVFGKDINTSLSGVIKDWQSSLETTQPSTEAEKLKQEEIKNAILGSSKTKEQPQLAPANEPSSSDTTMSDVKEELVKLNINVRELIAHTDRVVDGIATQTRATKSAATGNRL